MNEDRDLGAVVPDAAPPPHPDALVLQGRTVHVVPLDPARHGPALWSVFAGNDGLWTYMPVGPFPTPEAFDTFLAGLHGSRDPVFFAFTTPEGRAIGMGSFLRISPTDRSIEVGYLCFSPRMQRTPAATEAMALMMRWAFENGYRRYEWKCNALNLPSRRAAERLGLSYEGVFRQATIIKGRNRDTAWFAAIDAEWPALQAAFSAWLDPANFDAEGHQRTRLSDRTAPLLYARDPGLLQD